MDGRALAKRRMTARTGRHGAHLQQSRCADRATIRSALWNNEETGRLAREQRAL
jgi:hypothetical protein